MLYPDFNELVGLKSKVSNLVLSSRRTTLSNSMGDNISPFRGQGMEFEEVREYSAGDDIRSIDWRVTARTGKAHTKVFKEERERSVILCIDVNDYMRFGTKTTFKSIQAAKIAAMLGWRANSNNDRVGSCLFGGESGLKYFSPKRSRKSLLAMFKQLSSIAEYKQKITTLEDMLSHINKAAPTGSLIYIISDFSIIGKNLEHSLTNLKKRCDVILIAVDDIADKIIPPVGTLLFSNDDEKLYVNTDSIDGRSNYTKLWQQTRKNIQNIASNINTSIIEISTDEDPYYSLVLNLRNIGRIRSKQ